tara:strand:- start:324 stop:800 length:477 start_codon:yes stop_codon:yes gene_type:complete
MEILKNQIELIRYDSDEISKEYQKLIKHSQDALAGSYAPYSSFPVGAAVLLENDEIIIGSNQENAAYPSGLCAERTALFFTGASHPKAKIVALAVVVQNPIGRFPFPCGSCLQVMSEFQDKQNEPYDILMVHPNTGEVLLSSGIENLLPYAFRKSHLK